MKRKVVAVSIIASAFAIAAVSGVNASSFSGETEIAGVSKMIENYYYSQSDSEEYDDPEAVIPLTDNFELGNEADSASAVNEYNQSDVASVVAEGSTSQDVTPVVTDGALTETASAPTVTPTPEPVSEYADTGISIANEYVNIRKKPNVDSKILGKLYRGSAAKITDRVKDWVKIKSGNVQGYIKAEYLAMGFDAEDLVDKYGTKIATVKTSTLFVREERNTDCAILTLVSEDEKLEVTKEFDDWCKVIIDEDTKGYVAKEYVDVKVHFKKAISIKEEREQIRRQKEREEMIRRMEAEAAAAAAAAQAQRTTSYQRSSSSGSSSSGSSHSHTSSSLSGSKSKSSSGSLYGSSVGKDGVGSDAASYAQNFIGNPYSYGGTSLTNGTDCSGFVQSVYKKYGVSLPRTSGSQSGSGTKVDLDNLEKGDLVFYSSGGHVNHVAIYIGDGKVVHASNKREGIKTSNVNYRTPATARRVAK